MKLKSQEKRLLWLFFFTLAFNTLSNILPAYLSSSSAIITSISLLVVSLILEIFLVAFSIKEIMKGNKALGIVVLVLAIIDILMIILSIVLATISRFAVA